MALDKQTLSPSKAALLARWRNGSVRLPDPEEFSAGASTRLAECSFQQQFMWERQQEHPALPLYTISYCARFDAPVDVEIFMSSARELFMRHEALRTRFEVTTSTVQQLIDPAPPADPEFIDLRHLGVDDAESAAIDDAEGRLVRKAFNMTDEPLIRSALYQIADNAHVIAIVAHHLIADGFSLGIALSELDELYGAKMAGRSPRLRPVTVQYRDFARWQQDWLRREGWRADLDYWRSQLAGLPPARLPYDHEAPPERSFRCAGKDFVLSRRQSAMLRDYSQREGVSVFMTTLAGLQVLLARTTGTGDVTVGVPTLNRRHPQTRRLVGYFINHVVVRTAITDSLTFRDVLARVRDGVLGGLAHQSLHLALYQMVDPPDGKRGKSPNWANLIDKPLYRTRYVLQPPLNHTELAGATLQPRPLDRGVSIYDLGLYMWDAEPLYGRFEYAVDIFDELTMDRFVSMYFAIVEQAMANPAVRIADLRI